MAVLALVAYSLSAPLHILPLLLSAISHGRLAPAVGPVFQYYSPLKSTGEDEENTAHDSRYGNSDEQGAAVFLRPTKIRFRITRISGPSCGEKEGTCLTPSPP